MLKSSITSIILSCFTIYPALSEDCSSILKLGIWESQSYSDDIYEDSSFLNWACNSENQKNNKGLNIKADGYGELGANNDVEVSKNACSRTESGYVISKSVRERAVKASKDIVEAWKGCMNANGSNASVTYGGDPKNFILKFKRSSTDAVQKPNEETVRVSFTKGNSPDCTVSIDKLNSGVTFNGEDSISCVREDPSKEIYADVKFTKTGGGQSIRVAANPKVDKNSAESILEFKVYSADDEMNCFLNGNFFVGAVFGSPPKTLKLNPSLKSGKNTISCTPKDTLQQGGHACWAYQAELIKNGDVIASPQGSCCSGGCPVNPPPFTLTINK